MSYSLEPMRRHVTILLLESKSMYKDRGHSQCPFFRPHMALCNFTPFPRTSSFDLGIRYPFDDITILNYGSFFTKPFLWLLQFWSPHAKRSVNTQSDSGAPHNKGYRRDIWSHGTNCTVSFCTTPYVGSPQTH